MKSPVSADALSNNGLNINNKARILLSKPFHPLLHDIWPFSTFIVNIGIEIPAKI